VETVDGRPSCSTDITPEEREEIRSAAARCHSRRCVDVLVAPPEPSEREDEAPLRYHVDPMTRKLRKEPQCDPRLRGLPLTMGKLTSIEGR
jgi:hypothetical protein